MDPRFAIRFADKPKIGFTINFRYEIIWQFLPSPLLCEKREIGFGPSISFLSSCPPCLPAW